MFLGCDLSKNTYLHGVEEWNNVPNRLTKKQQQLFIERGAAKYCKIGNAHSVLASAKQMADIASEVLQKDPDYFAAT